MARIYTLGNDRPGHGWQLRFSLTGFALFWGEWPARKTFQFHWAGYIPFYIIYGDSFDRRKIKLFRK